MNPTQNHPQPPNRLRILGLLLLATVVTAAVALPLRHRDALVVYCAHDAAYAEAILRRFEDRTGIDVVIRFDTESTKSLGLVNLLLQERNKPRCDVFWNNQLMGTLDLMDEGLLVPYRGVGYDRMPARYKDTEGRWTGFSGRMRGVIVNTDRVSRLDEIGNLPASQMAIAKPLYGTTRSHFTVLWHLWGGEQLQTWHRNLLSQGLLEVPGNSTVKNLVAAGKRDFGWTDSDDYYVAVDEGRPVDLQPYRLETGQTICIPNTVAIVKGCDRMAEAKQLVDFLLSAATEQALARSSSRQIPLGPVDTSSIPAEVAELRQWAEDSYDLTQLGASRAACLAWLRSEYGQ